MNHPETIRCPRSFDKSQWRINCPHCGYVIGYDGIFDWGWVLDAIGYTCGRTKCMPSDLDGVVERHCHFLVFETKDDGVQIPRGQLILLDHLHKMKSMCVMKVWGKIEPQSWEAVFSEYGHQVRRYCGIGPLSAWEFVHKWFECASRNPVRMDKFEPGAAGIIAPKSHTFERNLFGDPV